MSFTRLFLLSVTLVLGACANHDGLYAPRCIAYEGDRVTLAGDRFVWRKFTDQQQIDAQGELIDPFPGFPKIGAIDIQTDRIAFLADDGSEIEDHFIVDHLDDWFLLPPDEHQQFLTAGELSNCALQRQAKEN